MHSQGGMNESYGANDWIFHNGKPLPSLKMTQLHHIVGGQTWWTDETWAEAASYLKAKLSAAQMMTLSGFTADASVLTVDDTRALRGAFFKGDQLEVFRRYPPTVLVAFFDLARLHKVIR